MHAQWDSFNRLAHVSGFWQRLEKVPADLIERVYLAFVCRVDHLDGIHPAPAWNIEAPQLGKLIRAAGIHGNASRKLVRNSPHLGPALDSRVPAYGHQSALLPADKASRQCEVDDGPNVRNAVS